MSMRLGGWLAWLMIIGGCFSEESSTPVELPPGCSLGAHLCPCDGDKCDPGLTCSTSAKVCVAIDCQVGALECPCGMDGACNPGFVCTEYGWGGRGRGAPPGLGVRGGGGVRRGRKGGRGERRHGGGVGRGEPLGQRIGQL